MVEVYEIDCVKTHVIRTCTQLEAAEIQARLEAENIPVVLFNQAGSVTSTVLGGGSSLVDVCVRAEDQERALQALGLVDAGSPIWHSMAESTAMVQQGLRSCDSPDDIAARLVEMGWPEASAQSFVQTHLRDISARQAAYRPDSLQQAAYHRQMLAGLAWLIGGAVLTWLTMQGSEVGLIFFGAIVYGLSQFFSGLIGWWRSRH